MSEIFDEMLALAGVSPSSVERAQRLSEARAANARQRQRRLKEATEIDPRVVQYVKELDGMTAAVGDQIEAIYAQANAASSIDPQTAGDLQAAAGDLRTALSKVFAELDRAKERIAPVSPRSVAP